MFTWFREFWTGHSTAYKSKFRRKNKLNPAFPRALSDAGKFFLHSRQIIILNWQFVCLFVVVVCFWLCFVLLCSLFFITTH